MVGLSIQSVRDFSLHLFVRNSFDEYLLSEARFTTDFFTCFEGRCQRALPAQDEPFAYVCWRQIKPFAYRLIQGKVLPESFFVSLIYPKDKTLEFISRHDLSAEMKDLPLLFLNLRYQQGKLLLTNGISEKVFRPEMRTPSLWDKEVIRILEDLSLAYS
ncbi:MAG: hypothetical protein J6H18_03605 [Lachnospiraceae bacterium]|nr:hypothetical protein [Lachnospiraceae bacterium]